MAPIPEAEVPQAAATHSDVDNDATSTHHQSTHHRHARNSSHTDYQSVASEALATPPDGQSPPPKLLSCLSTKSRGDGSKPRTQASGVVFEGFESWDGWKGGARKRAPPSFNSSPSRRHRRPEYRCVGRGVNAAGSGKVTGNSGSKGIVNTLNAWGLHCELVSAHPKMAPIGKQKKVSSLTSNDQVGANLVTELTWAVSDMHNQASQHSHSTNQRVQQKGRGDSAGIK
eukprot:1137847-Pelagomonas_calceolata.AAC.1